jgi:hypothetical protein
LPHRLNSWWPAAMQPNPLWRPAYTDKKVFSAPVPLMVRVQLRQ